MIRFQLGGGSLVALCLLTGNAHADEPNKAAADTARSLIDKLVAVSEPDTGYSGSVSGTSFLPLARSESHMMLLGQRPHAESDTMRTLVKLGVKVVPTLLEHLSDDRRTKIVIEHSSIVGGFHINQDKGEMAEEKFGEGFEARTRYTVRVGDLCYVALGQIVNRQYTAIRYQPTAIIYATCVPKYKQLREELKMEWGGLTPDRHRDSLARDLDSDNQMLRQGASVRLAYYYPEAFEPLILKQLARPAYDVFAVSGLIHGELFPAKSAEKRKALVDAFVKQHGEIARVGIRWELFDRLDSQEADEEGRSSRKRDPPYQARECLVEVFGLPATVKSKDRPKGEPLSNTAQARFVETLLFDRSDKIDKVVRNILAKTDRHSMAEGCLNRLIGRGYDSDIETYLKRQLPKARDEWDREELKKYEAKLGWTRLHAAVDLDVPELIASSLKDKLDVNARGKNGRTALHLAAADGKAAAVEMLLKVNADPNVKDGQGRLAVQLASDADHPEVVRRIVAAKSELPDVFTAVIVGNAAKLSELLKGKRHLVNDRNKWGYTPLHVAAREGQEAAIRILLDAGSDVNAMDVATKESLTPSGWTALHLAVMSENPRAAKLLLDRRADASAVGMHDKMTPLHYAAWRGDAEMVKVLLAAKADRGAKDANERTPLDLAKEREHSAVVKLLEEAK